MSDDLDFQRMSEIPDPFQPSVEAPRTVQRAGVASPTRRQVRKITPSITGVRAIRTLSDLRFGS